MIIACRDTAKVGQPQPGKLTVWSFVRFSVLLSKRILYAQFGTYEKKRPQDGGDVLSAVRCKACQA